MKRYYYLLLINMIFLASCDLSLHRNTEKFKLGKIINGVGILTDVVFHENTGLFFALNGNRISLIEAQGEVIQPNWVTGLAAPKQIFIKDKIIYVILENGIKEIELRTGKVLKSSPMNSEYKIVKASQLPVGFALLNSSNELMKYENNQYSLIKKIDREVVGLHYASGNVSVLRKRDSLGKNQKFTYNLANGTIKEENKIPTGNLAGIVDIDNENFYTVNPQKGYFMKINKVGKPDTLIRVKKAISNFRITKNEIMLIAGEDLLIYNQ